MMLGRLQFKKQEEPCHKDMAMKISLDAGKPKKKLDTIRQRIVKKPVRWAISRGSFAAPQRLNARGLSSVARNNELAYVVGLLEGDGWFNVSKNQVYIKFEVGIELSVRDVQLLYKLKEIIGVGRVELRKNNKVC